MFFADFQKAFDSIEYNFIFNMLKKFKFGDQFQRWIKLLYINPMAYIKKNNGYLSDTFHIYRGIRQGCPVSALIFILCMEVLAGYIRQNNEIQGLKLDKYATKYVKIVQYADDATIFVKNQTELVEVIKAINEFGKFSGTQLNLLKCEGLWLGADKDRQSNCNICGINWPTLPIKYLGIYIGHDKETCNKLNFDDKVKAIEVVLRQHRRRHITYFGKVCVIKSFVLSKFMYTALCIPVPDKSVVEINKLLFKYIWGERDRIKRKTVINTIETGGLNMFDLASQVASIQATWVSRIINAPDSHKWSYLPKRYLSQFGDNFLILTTTVTEKSQLSILHLIPEFYRNIILSYNKAKEINLDDFHYSLKEQMIWGNKFITYKKKCLYFKSWIDEDIIMIKDLKINDGDLDIQYLFNRLKNKQNFYIEANMLSIALKKAHINISTNPMEEIANVDEITVDNNSNKIKHASCKQLYSNIVKTVIEKPSAEKYWSNFVDIQTDHINFVKVYRRMVSNIKDKKLAETNFKIIHNILPCNKNLLKWGKKNSSSCDVCQSEETIPHMLFDCPYAKKIWKVVLSTVNIDYINMHKIILSNLDNVQMHLISIVIYFIYKDWLVNSLENTIRTDSSLYVNFMYYLITRKNTYVRCSDRVWVSIIKQLQKIISYIETYVM